MHADIHAYTHTHKRASARSLKRGGGKTRMKERGTGAGGRVAIELKAIIEQQLQVALGVAV